MSRGAENSKDNSHLLKIPSYFSSPVDTLIASLDRTPVDEPTVHDLLDAYGTFSLRIKAVAVPLSQDTTPDDLHALRYIRHNSALLGRSIQRDIRRALFDPLPDTSNVANLDMLTDTSFPDFTASDERLFAAKHISMLCQLALQLVSNIFRLPVLHRLFPNPALQQILDDVLAVAQSSDLPIPDSYRTRCIAAWIFSTLQLDSATVQASQRKIQNWIGDLAASMSNPQRACDVVHHMLSTYPQILRRGFAKLLPEILSQLVSTVPSTRTDALIALSGYTLAMLSTAPSTEGLLISDVRSAVHSFIRSQLSQSRTDAERAATSGLPDYIAWAAREKSSTHTISNGPRWAIATICCLTVLSGPGIFTGTRPLKLVLETVGQIGKSKSSTAMDLMACAWKCLVWAFLHIRQDEAGNSSSSARDVAFNIVRQELRAGVGASLVAGLLKRPAGREGHDFQAVSDMNIEWAISVLRDMISHSSVHVYREGVALLERLTSGIGASTQCPEGSATSQDLWTLNDIVVKALFSRHVLKAESRTFSAALRTANILDASVVRPLDEVEVLAHWGSLMDILVTAFERELTATDASAIPDGLVHAWQGILLVQTQLTQEQAHLTTTPDFTKRAVSVLTGLLERDLPHELNRVSPLELQRRILMLCLRLWTVMRHVFSEHWLCSAAEALLTSVLHHSFDLSDERVRSAWGDLCSTLLSSSVPDLIARLVVEDEEHRVVDTKRQLWRMAAREWRSRTPEPCWQQSIDFLATPIRFWSMDEEEVSMWKLILDGAVAQAVCQSEYSLCVYGALLRALSDGTKFENLLSAPGIVVHMLDRLRLPDNLKEPSAFLRCINTFLCELYCDTPERISMALQMLKAVRQVVSTCPAGALIGFIEALTDGLAKWIGDEDALLINAEYNDAAMPLYCEALKRLRDTTITADALSTLAHFLYSAFIRIPDPCDGPVVFYEFWTHIQPSLKHLRGAYPEEIKTALRACQDVFGGLSSQDVSVDTESHTDSQANRTPDQISPVKSESITPKLAAEVRTRILELRTTPRAASRQFNPSPVVSPEIPFLPTSPTTPLSSVTKRKRARREAISISPDKLSHHASSDFMPSSPTDAIRARRAAAGPLIVSRTAHERAAKPLDRPLKRQRVDTSPRTPKFTTYVMGESLRNSPPEMRSGLPDDGVEDMPYKGQARRASAALSTTPRSTTSRSTGKRAVSPALADPVEEPSDDYDAWEAPICEDDVPRPADDDDEVVPDSQPSDAGADDDSLLPSYMKTSGRGHAEYGAAHSDDTMILDGLQFDDIPNPRAQHRNQHRPGSPLRMHTAPASLHLEDSSSHLTVPLPEPEPALRRARTASAQLDELRNVYDALREEGSQLPVGDIAAASELTSKLGALLSEKLSRKLREGSVDSGPSSSLVSRKDKGKGKGKQRE
ncbi:hypothetical protein GY45DRAFT_1292253 [Cubamyces sp. BRFM 1775]|nr:hypothetical protein GY45DRAFT_1292253 [Cubamyces sp. BRFM 1775]